MRKGIGAENGRKGGASHGNFWQEKFQQRKCPEKGPKKEKCLNDWRRERRLARST